MATRTAKIVSCYYRMYADHSFVYFFFFNDTATTEIYTLSLHDALPIWPARPARPGPALPGHALLRGGDGEPRGDGHRGRRDRERTAGRATGPRVREIALTRDVSPALDRKSVV